MSNQSVVRIRFSGPTRQHVVCSKEAAAWLNTLPIASFGLQTEQDLFQMTIGLQLGLPVCFPHKCRNCGVEVDQFGLHGLSCRSDGGKFFHYNLINDVIKRTLESAKIPCVVEHSGISRAMVNVPTVLL